VRSIRLARSKFFNKFNDLHFLRLLPGLPDLYRVTPG
jgi:hypothetical protein